tara:strand:+ start:456 stop:704 length:249 start_codon:yes stop_codon:yes gene_type:complete
MGLVEGFAEYALESNGETVTEEDYHNFQMKFLALVIVIKLMMVFVVSKFLWPKVVPKVFTGVKSNPRFVDLLGLVIIYYLLF